MSDSIHLIVDRIVHDVCAKRVALLGESPTHGFGESLQLEVEIARRLVDECHFNAFIVESGAYDFLKFRKSRRLAGRSTVPATFVIITAS